jgi:toxin ParE1/3/4
MSGLIRADQDRQRLRDLLLDCAASPATAVADDAYFTGLRERIGEPKRSEPEAGRPARGRASRRRRRNRLLHPRSRPDIALGLIDALQSAYRVVAERPSAGSPRYTHELAIPGLRSRTLKNYPYLVFYVERDNRIDIWRSLHSRRDIPGRVREAECGAKMDK